MNKNLTEFYADLLDSGEALHPIEFFAFLFDIIYNTSLAEKMMTGSDEKAFHLSPEKICSLFSSRASQEFGSFSKLVLETWNVRSSSDIGRAVFKMAEHKCLTLLGTETMRDFERAGLDLS
ncbi:hypothetical protein ACFL5V_10210 [Fibrobacterota bacterium]